jgi:hypothetical protein
LEQASKNQIIQKTSPKFVALVTSPAAKLLPVNNNTNKNLSTVNSYTGDKFIPGKQQHL